MANIFLMFGKGAGRAVQESGELEYVASQV